MSSRSNVRVARSTARARGARVGDRLGERRGGVAELARELFGGRGVVAGAVDARAAVGDDDARAASHELARDGLPDAARAAGDERDAS